MESLIDVGDVFEEVATQATHEEPYKHPIARILQPSPALRKPGSSANNVSQYCETTCKSDVAQI
jgi:hypothetical protein